VDDLAVARHQGARRDLVVGVDGDLCRVETGGQIVTAFRVAPCQIGDSVSVAIRPERVAVDPKPGLYGNELDAKIDDIVFLGDHLRLRMTVCDTPDFIAKIPNIVGHGAVLEGDRVRVGWTLTDARALEPDDSGEGSP
jgi:putative spermidine/putrescine transport system ATP-binding protein